jgi:hypothetical protein
MVGAVAFPGDRGITGDSLLLNSTTLNEVQNPANAASAPP